MEDFYNSLNPVQKIFLFSAVVGGVIFIVRMVLMLTGLGDHDVQDGHFDYSDAHADADTSFKLFSLHGLTGFS